MGLTKPLKSINITTNNMNLNKIIHFIALTLALFIFQCNEAAITRLLSSEKISRPRTLLGRYSPAVQACIDCARDACGYVGSSVAYYCQNPGKLSDDSARKIGQMAYDARVGEKCWKMLTTCHTPLKYLKP